jgi:hypothetical protein
VIRFSGPAVEYCECGPNARRSRRDYMRGECAYPTAVVSRRIVPGAIPSTAGSAAERTRRRNSGRHCRAWSRRIPRRRCIRSCRFVPRSNVAEDPCRNIRSSAEVAAPSSSRQVEAGRMVANQTRDSNDEYPSISVTQSWSDEEVTARPATRAQGFRCRLLHSREWPRECVKSAAPAPVG